MSLEDRLKKLEEQRLALDRKIRQNRERLKTEERKQDTRRKIILGGLVEKHCALHPESVFARDVAQLIDQYVTGPTERALFDLKEPSSEQAPDPNPQSPRTPGSRTPSPPPQNPQAQGQRPENLTTDSLTPAS